MLAGVLLGPSLLGLLVPDAQNALFPAPLPPVLYVVGQVDLVLFMFQAGYAFSAHRVTGLAGTAGVISKADGTSLGVSAAFVGVTLAITAFPMLARIITEHGHAGTRHGTLSLASDTGQARLLVRQAVFWPTPNGCPVPRGGAVPGRWAFGAGDRSVRGTVHRP